jgi:hypothetical protein
MPRNPGIDLHGVEHHQLHQKEQQLQQLGTGWVQCMIYVEIS